MLGTVTFAPPAIRTAKLMAEAVLQVGLPEWCPPPAAAADALVTTVSLRRDRRVVVAFPLAAGTLAVVGRPSNAALARAIQDWQLRGKMKVLVTSGGMQSRSEYPVHVDAWLPTELEMGVARNSEACLYEVQQAIQRPLKAQDVYLSEL